MEKVLIVEDELIVARDIRKTLERNGHKVTGVARSVEKAFSLIEEERPTLALVDIFLKGELTGIDLAARLNEEGIPFIYVSANSNQPVLEAAKTTNPYGFIVKPFREKDLLVTIDIARYRYEQSRQWMGGGVSAGGAVGGVSAGEVSAMSAEERISVQGAYARTGPYGKSAAGKNAGTICEGLIGKSAGMLQVFNLIAQVAPFDTSVLVLGESGTGKEVVANCIYQQSLRSGKPYIKINCGAIPSGLMEAELFGYERGAFTGAADRKAGKFEMAAGGTMLLDEIGEMPLDMQAKLLRVLQEKEIQRIGSSTLIKTDVRVIAATSRNLEKEVSEGRFRLDLYYRLHVFPITLPPLRQRREGIPMLVEHFIRYYSEKAGKKIRGLDAPLMKRLLEYPWPGNVRELQHLIERSVLLATTDTIHEMELPKIAGTLPAGLLAPGPAEREETMERALILDVLGQCQFRIAGKGGAAELLNLTPNALHAKIKKLGIRKGFE